MAIPSAGYGITIRLEVRPDPSEIGRLTTALGAVGGVVTALDVVESHTDRMVVDISTNANDAEHTTQLTDALGALDGVNVRKVSDRTFLLHLGGKIEVRSKVGLKTRDELSMAYTPGVARICLAIRDNPEDVRRLTIKRNTVAGRHGRVRRTRARQPRALRRRCR
jgi:malate dehydrogenase (oxaloacetate-decarboxylating)